MLSRIYHLLNYCYKDNTGDKFSDIELQLFLIAAKCIMPYEDKIGCYFDIDRYKKEIELFKFYKNGHDEALENYLENKKPLEKYDELLEFKIIPIIIANTQWDVLINEALKTTLFCSINNNAIINTIILSSMINEYLDKICLDKENIEEITKVRVINFSLKDFYLSNNIQTSKNSLIEFEKERIKILTKNEIITDELKGKYKTLQYIYNEIKNETEEIDNETVLSTFSQYLFKLRKGIINPEKLKIPTDNIPSIKEFLKYASFSHPLLGRCKVIRRGEKEVILKNKSGLLKVNI